MRIGILTYHSVYNFGANLQVYSTIEYLKNNGFEPIVINWVPEDREMKSYYIIPPIQSDAHKKFINEYIPCSELCKTDDDIAEIIEKEKIKGVIIGSDALFQHKPFLSRIHLKKKGIIIDPTPSKDRKFPNPFWGSFISLLKEKIPVIAMSVSSQNTAYYYIRGGLKRKICSALKQFQYITVRDEWARKMITYLTNGSIVPLITPDPVFAYNQNIKKQLSKKELIKKFNLPDNYILVSFRTQNVVSREWLKTFKILADKNKLVCIALTMPNGITFDNPFSNIIEPPLCPGDWYGLIKFSVGYIGENLHPIIVTLHNSIPFYSFDSYGILRYKFFVNEKSSKINDLLATAGFLQNKVNILGRGYKCPAPEEVIQKVINFDFAKCEMFSIEQLNKYNNMMKNILDYLIS